ncbi:BMP family ABC transporter substrate-binding protein (plasmid) [Azospirillum humicireducens]|uniref:BMP family ABC transporter substrate-binding protein n=1 Tax=Azospirillum humicireducens TaxID=1226968 RepID=A0A2R4VQ64_9PROT|nr:BMP family ABC transporter substrate-binding protein [Azospirillum humicireducens]AWB06570.1 BMP family ABC transporter substrate-binding protein [Azospirillum humicireducens]
MPFLLIMLFVVAMASPGRAETPADRQFAIIFNNTKTDGGFNELALRGLQRFKTETGIDARENIIRTEEESVRSMRNFAHYGIRNILLIGFVNEGAVSTVAQEFPDVHFTLIDGRVDLPNVRSILFREDEAAYLVGMAAGLASGSGTVGFIGAVPIPPIKRFECGFVQGVMATRPSARLLRRFLGSDANAFRDKDAAHSMTDQLIAEGADVAFAAAGYAGTAVLERMAAAGHLGIGVDTNQNVLFPGHVLTSALKRVDVAAYLALRDAHEGTWTAGVQHLGLAERGVDWARDEANASLVAGLAPRLETAAAEIAGGRLAVQPAELVEACR